MKQVKSTREREEKKNDDRNCIENKIVYTILANIKEVEDEENKQINYS